MNYCIYNNRELTVKQYEEYKLQYSRPYIECKNGIELVYVSKSIDNRKSHFRYKNIPKWYLDKYGKGGESELHLIIKEHLYNSLQKDGYDCIMDMTLENVIPDILEINRNIAYEIVTGYINEKMILEKTQKYKDLNHIVFWYIHEKNNKFKHLMGEMKGYLFILDFSEDRKKYLKYFTETKFM